MFPRRLRTIRILPPVGQTNNVFRHWQGGKQAVRKYGYELKWAVREAQLINMILLAPAGIHVYAQKNA